jgi:hypothetical protein
MKKAGIGEQAMTDDIRSEPTHLKLHRKTQSYINQKEF